jgi:competence protein ComEA
VVEAAEAPDEPVSPRTVRNTLIGLGAGLLVGVVAALVANGRDRRVPEPERRDETELARETGEIVPVEVGAVPIDDARSRTRAPPPEPEGSAVLPPEPDGPVDLNEVTYEELRALDLTMTQARRLLAYRDRRGGFSSLSDIDEVPGFPEYVREDLKRRVSL